MKTVTYVEHNARMDSIAAQLERVAYRLRQGAISEESAIELLNETITHLDTRGGS